MTHDELVKVAERWVRNTQRRYPIVLSDVRTTAVSELPDVIAFGGSGSLLVEVKVSRADFVRDAGKPFRRDPKLGMGSVRYYAAPPGVIAPRDLPTHWGLLEPTGHGSLRVVVKHPRRFVPNATAERAVLVVALQRAIGGWGRKVFGDDAPPMVDGDPHPSAAALILELRRERDELHRKIAELVAASSKA